MPDTNCIKFCNNIGLSNDYENTIDFITKQEQDLYWDSKVKLSYTYENVKWTTKNKIKVGANYNDVKDFSYAFFENIVNSVKKRTYCFLLNCEIVGNGVVEFTYEVDVMQTYLFDYNIKESFIEREHQNRYEKITKGGIEYLKPLLNPLPEELDVGNYHFYKQIETENLNADIKCVRWAIVLAKDLLITGDLRCAIDSISTGLFVYMFPVGLITSNGNIINDNNIRFNGDRVPVRLINNPLELNTKVLSIEYTNYLPFPYTVTLSGSNYNIELTYDANYGYNYVNYATGVKFANLYSVYKNIYTKKYNFNIDANGLEDLQGLQLLSNYAYTNLVDIKYETKLLLYPYRDVKLIYGDNEKTINISKYNFEFAKITQLFDLNYSCIINALSDNVEFTNDDILINKSNEITLGTDRWLDYELNNKSTLKSGLLTKAITTGATLGLGIATGGVGLAVAGSTVLSASSGVLSEMMKREDIKESPDEIRKSNGNFLVNNIKFNNQVCLQIYDSDLNYIIFKYFQKYGYKSKTIKIPNLKSRYYYNFIKTISVNIIGNINNENLEKIKNIFNKGITFWHFRNLSTFLFLDYSKENVEMLFVNEGGV